jgi:hypothetical protein
LEGGPGVGVVHTEKLWQGCDNSGPAATGRSWCLDPYSSQALTQVPQLNKARAVPAYYWASVAQFCASSQDEVLGQLARRYARILEAEQRDAWLEEISLLQAALLGLTGTIFLEFDVPRLASRVDAVVLSGAAIFPIEFKCGASKYNLDDFNQAWDYALDLKNFHAGSRSAPVLPILVATQAEESDRAWGLAYPDSVRPPYRCNGAGLGDAIRAGLAVAGGPSLVAEEWGGSPYRPTPTIIEAARALYSRHSVEAISRHDADAKNLSLTSTGVEEIIDQSRRRGEKAIVFVTGVPGAGKTLVGLNVATLRRESGDTHAVFLSGNGPLVAVLQEALTRDELQRRGAGARKGEVRQAVKPFIQNVHHFRDEGLRRDDAPFDHVVIFDEAQRAWNLQKTADFMKRRKGFSDFRQSEPEFLLSYLDRHREWAVVVCLVGGGQEIHTGEAGIGAWLDAARERFPGWRLYISPELKDSEYAAAQSLTALSGSKQIVWDERLHLAVSMRSFRSERVSGFVKCLLDLDTRGASALLREVSERYPMAVMRDLNRAKQWIRDHARGTERYGLVASSQAYRLKPHAVDVRMEVNPIHYFLAGRNDTRLSYYLEDAATEFQIQGLELDWVCVGLCADLRLKDQQWGYNSFRGDMWTRIHKPERQRYLINAYRVLLTRARQGMVIFVPPGDDEDPTRRPSYYDETYDYLATVGIERI